MINNELYGKMHNWGVWVILQASHEVFAAGYKSTEINDKKDW